MPRLSRLLLKCLLVALLLELLVLAGCRKWGSPLVAAEPALPGIDHPDEVLTRRLRQKVAQFARRGALVAGVSPYANRLVESETPYLFESSREAVNWRVWSEEAWEVARKRKLPVLVVVGYSSCHFCHRMSEESFSDPGVAALINANFVAIKVDRESRPDLDQRFSELLVKMNRRVGWPMMLVFTPEEALVTATTYLPKLDTAEGKGFLSFLESARKDFSSRSRCFSPEGEPPDADSVASCDAARARAVSLQAILPSAIERQPRPTVANLDAMLRIAKATRRSMDFLHGGFGKAPKFPEPLRLRLLMRALTYLPSEERSAFAVEVEKTFDALKEGAIHDPVSGGFFRYTTDVAFRKPHFEKMLGDATQIALAFSDAARATGRQDFLEVAVETLEHLRREFRRNEGGYGTALDADRFLSPGNELKSLGEGAYYLTTHEELANLLTAGQLSALCREFECPQAGAFVLSRKASRQGPVPAEASEALRVMRAAREKRGTPKRDDKVLVSLNGLTMLALARVGDEAKRGDFLEEAYSLGNFLWENSRTSEGEIVHNPSAEADDRDLGFLEDYAFLERGFLELFSVTGDKLALERASALQEMVERRFATSEGGYSFAPHQRHIEEHRKEARVLGSSKSASMGSSVVDGTVPSAFNVVLENLALLEAITGASRYETRFEEASASVPPQEWMDAPQFWLAQELRRGDMLKVFVAEPSSIQDKFAHKESDLRGALRALPPGTLTLKLNAAARDELEARVPWIQGKTARSDRATFYLCTRYGCSKPTDDLEIFDFQRREVLAERARLGGVEPNH